MNDARNLHPNSTNQNMAAMVAAYRQSGLSLKTFARNHGVRPTQLHYWVYKKSQDSKVSWLGQQPPVDQTSVFQEVKLEAGSALLQSWAAEISLSRGLIVRFSGQASPDWIGGVIEALDRLC